MSAAVSWTPSAAELGEAVHRPDRGLAAVVLPQDVGEAVAVVVARADDVPGWARIGTDCRAADLVKTVHCPNCRLAGVVLPQDVGLAVAVEVGGTHGVP